MADVRRPHVAAALAVSMLLLAACGGSGSGPQSAPTPQQGGTSTAKDPTTTPHPRRTPPQSSASADKAATTPTPPETPTTTRPENVHDHGIVGEMSLRDKARQLLVVGFSGTTAPRKLIRNLRPGGLIYFSDNLTSNDQIRSMSASAQRTSRRSGQPLLIMTDQEGGLVTRLPGTEDVPGGADFDGDAGWASRTAKHTGQLLDSLGINTNLAPVADVNTAGDSGVIGSRSFSSDPDVAARMVRAQVCGYHAGGVAATAKHFPGHGSTDTDSHAETATIARSRKAWRSTDLPPFTSAVGADVDMILLGHLAFPAVDPSGRPATISGKLNRGLLRRQLGFDGVVITDALNMGGITSWGPSGSIAVRSIKAGSDMLLMPPQPSNVVSAIVAAVQSGRLSEHRLDRSVQRILRLKKHLGLYAGAADLPTC